MSINARRLKRGNNSPQISSLPNFRDISDTRWKAVSLAITSTAENSSTNWENYYSYIEDIQDGRGYTGGLVGFCSGTGDMLDLVQYADTLQPNNILTPYIPKLQQIMAAPYSNRPALSHSLLDPGYVPDWQSASSTSWFKQAQRYKRDQIYWNPAYSQAQADGLSALGLVIYYDVSVNHGPGEDWESFGGIITTAKNAATPPSMGGNEKTYLNAVITARDDVLKSWDSYQSNGRSSSHTYLLNSNFTLALPINWSVYGDNFSLPSYPVAV